MTSQPTKTNSPFGDKRTALAFFLSLIVIITYQELIIKPTQHFDQGSPVRSATNETGSSDSASLKQGAQTQGAQAPKAQGPQASSTTLGANAATNSEVQTTTMPKLIPTAKEIEASKKTTIATSLYEAKFSHLGGRLESFTLSNHTKNLGGEEPYDLVSRSEKTPLPLGTELLGGTDALLSFQAPAITIDGKPANKTSTLSITDKQELRMVFSIPLTDGNVFTKSYRFIGGTYFVDITSSLKSSPTGAPAPLKLTWNAFFPKKIAESSYDPVSFSTFLATEKVEHTLAAKFDPEEKAEKLVHWASLGDKYFMASLIAEGAPQPATFERVENEYTVALTGSASEVKAKVFLGPKNYSDLKALDFELHRNVNLGIFSLLAIPLLTVINFCYGLLGNYGLAIILLTLSIKLLFLPLTQASFKSMKAMQDLQPEIKALRERIKDPNQLNQETFALYKRKGVNPMGGCLPMIIQIPVFLGLYNALLNATELRHAPYALWITDLSAPEALLVGGIPIPIMIIFMGISMFFQQWLTPSNMDEQQKKVMMMMPVMFTVMFIIFPFPSGLVLYWLVNNLISIVQQVYLRTDRSMGPIQGTVVASIGIFFVGFVLTLI